jgi:hypothetical protein
MQKKAMQKKANGWLAMGKAKAKNNQAVQGLFCV